MKKYILFLVGLLFSISSIEAQSKSDNIDPDKFNHTLFEQLIFTKVNEYRVTNGRTALINNSTIYKVAKDHNDFLKTNGELTHDQPTTGKRTVQERLLHYMNVKKYAIGENIARTFVLTPTYNYDEKGETSLNEANTYEEAATYMLNAWIQSDAHRENILKDKYQLGAIASYFNPNDKSLTAVQVFAKIE
jgi:uncharacterized protein YkwD